MKPLELFGLHPQPRAGNAPDNSSCASDCVSLGFGLRLRLFRNGVNLVEIAIEYGSVGNILGGLGELQQDDARANGEESQYDGNNGLGGALETLE